MRLETLGKTAQGRLLYAVRLNDPAAPEQDKEHVLITAQHSGIERSGATSVLLLVEWLLSGEPRAREILRHQSIIAMPVVNPDGYVAGSHANSLGEDPYTAWSLYGPKDPLKTLEAVAVQTMMDRHQPEVHADIHGVDLAFPGHSMIEESGQAYSNVSLRSYHQGIIDQMNAAAEAEGYPSDRLEQDAERIFWGPELNAIPEKVWAGRSRPYAAIYCYSRYHSLALASEIAWERSGLLRHRRLLEIGNETWSGEYYAGYPTRVIASNNYHLLTAYGRTAADRRASRIELWNKQSQITLAMNNPPTEGFVLYGCATSPAAAAQWFTDKTLLGFAEKLGQHPRVEAAPIRRLIESQVASEQRHVSRSPLILTGLALLGAVAAAAVIWINGREEPPRSFSSVAVLPFRTVSDSGDDYLADGITEALITRFTNLKRLRVVSDYRVRRFKGSSEEAAKIARQLGVEAVIDGTVRVASGRLRGSVHGVRYQERIHYLGHRSP